MQNIHEIKLKISGTNSNLPINIVQGDTNTRILQVSLINDDGSNYTPGQGVTAEYYSQKPDGTGTSHSATLSGNVVTVTLTEQDTAAAGMVYAAIRLKAGSQLLAAIPFMFKCIKFPMGNNVASTSEYQTMQDATNEANAAAETANEAATTAVQTANNAAQQALSIANTAADNANDAAEYATDAADTASNYNIDLLAEGYDATAIYVKGDYAIYQGALYRCITDIVTPEAWTASRWVAVELGADVQDAWRDATEGYSDTLTAGDLTSDEYQTDTEPYLFRRTFGGACNHEMDTLVGGTVAWNQLYPTHTDYAVSSGTVGGISVSVSDGFINVSGTATSDCRLTVMPNAGNIPANHVCLIICDGYSGFKWARAGFETALKSYYINKHNSDFKGNARIYIESGSAYDLHCRFSTFDLTQMFGTTIADAIYAMEQAESGSGVAWFRRYFPESYYAYNAGTLKSVEAVAHRMVGKNLIPKPTWSSKTASGVTAILLSDGQVSASGTGTNTAFSFIGYGSVLLPAGSYIFNGQNGVDSARKLLTLQLYNKTTETQITNKDTGTDYAFTLDAETLIEVRIGLRVGVSVTNAIMSPMIRYADVSDATYKPYVQHTYKLSPLTLRGITKLVDGKLQYDGDTYEPSGQVVRRYGVVNLATATLSRRGTQTSGLYRFAVKTTSNDYLRCNSLKIICNCLKTVRAVETYLDGQRVEYSISSDANDGQFINFFATDLQTNEAWHAFFASHNAYVVYELATPTTETASPYEPTQVVYADGTEEYISNSIVPVGHVTKYPISLKTKLNDLPDAFKLYDMLVHDSITEPTAVLSVSDGADDVPVKSMTIGIEPVQSGSGDPSPSNVRPISGWTQAQITRTGKNILSVREPASITVNGVTFTVRSDGMVDVSGTATSEANLAIINGKRADNHFTVRTGKYRYGLSATSQNVIVRFTVGDTASSAVAFNGQTASSKYFEVTEKTEAYAFLRVESGVTVNATVYPYFMTVSDSSETITYEPYNSNTYTVTLPDTVYGGELTVNRDGTGTLVVDRKNVDVDTLTISRYTDGTNPIFICAVDDIKLYSIGTTPNIICTQYAVGLPANTRAQVARFLENQYMTCIESGARVVIRDDSYTSVSDFKTAMSGVMLVYELATPQTYTLTAPQVRTLLGVNNIWTDTGDIESAVYPCDTKLYVDKQISELQALVLENISNS